MAGPIQNSRIQDLVADRVQAPRQQSVPRSSEDFRKLLEDRLKVSGHAQTRLQSRNIELDAQAWDRVLQGVEKADAKGARESLVLIDDVALVVSVKNRTVITAVDKEQLKDNVFTNIDSAVVV